jgi:hypothetical protein
VKHWQWPVLSVKQNVNSEELSMGADNDKLLQAMKQIARISVNASLGDGEVSEYDPESELGSELGSGIDPNSACTIMQLPEERWEIAARRAMTINPMNAPMMQMSTGAESDISRPQIAILTSKYWGRRPQTLTVSFVESASSALKQKIVTHLNAWSRNTSVRFELMSGTGIGIVRITLTGQGYWSYLGTDVLSIPRNQPTMCLSQFTVNTPDSEYRRVVRHEAGHTLGFPHEHMRRELVARIDPAKAYAYFAAPPNRWSRAMVDQNVLTSLDDNSLFRTRPDDTSIMCYQLPGSITRNGRPIVGGSDINATDAAFASNIYPPRSSSNVEAGAMTLESPQADDSDDMWDEYRDENLQD